MCEQDSTLEVFELLRGRALEGPPGWADCKDEFGLGSDAFRAFRATRPEVFCRARHWLTENYPHERSVLENPEQESLGTMLRVHHDALSAVVGSDAFWPILAHGITALLAAGGMPNLVETTQPVVLDYDQELALLSPSYTALRIAAFNDGVRLVAHDGGKAWFAPESRVTTIGRPFTETDARGVTHLWAGAAAHDTVHMVGYGDAYWGSDNFEERVIAAEEAATCFDLIFVGELLEHRRKLAMVEIFSRSEGFASTGTSRYVQRHLAQAPDAADDVQQFFTHTALAHLRSRPGPAWGHPDVDPFDWIGHAALRAHATYWSGFARAVDGNAWRTRLARPSVVDREQIDRARHVVDRSPGHRRPSWLGDSDPSPVLRRQRVREHETRRRLAVIADVLHRAAVSDDRVDIAALRGEACGLAYLDQFTHSLRSGLSLNSGDHHQLAELLADQSAVARFAFHRQGEAA